MVRRPENEYYLENEAEKKFIELPNGAKLRVLFIKADEPNENTKDIIFYSGFISYIYLWRESVKLLRKNHNIIFIETREKEFCSFPPNEVVYTIDVLGEDFYLAYQELGLDLNECVIAGSSVSSVGILEYMSEYDFRPFLSVHSSPQIHYPANNKPKILATFFPRWFVISLKPIIYLVYKIKFRRDKESGKSRIHTLSRMFLKSSLEWMKKIDEFLPEYNMKKESVENINAPVVFVGAQDDPEHDTGSVSKIIEYIPSAKFRPVPFKDDTHNEKFAQVILEEIDELLN